MPNVRKRAKHAVGTAGVTGASDVESRTNAAVAPSAAASSPSSTAGASAKHISKKPFLIIVALAAAILAIAIGVSLTQGGSDPDAGSSIDIEAPAHDLAKGEQNPIDFPMWMGRNNDMYAWLYVPGTQVNLPILQSPIADNYYLYHNIDKEDDPVGAAYTQALNSKDFTDSVTVIYGHTFESSDERANEAFGTLHDFEDPAFFAEHPYFYIYTASGMYTYRIVSAYTYDNRHILNSLDFNDPDEVQAYFDSVTDPDDENAMVIEEAGRLDAGTARLVQLSTCTRPADSDSRYIVTGVLEKTTALMPSW